MIFPSFEGVYQCLTCTSLEAYVLSLSEVCYWSYKICPFTVNLIFYICSLEGKSDRWTFHYAMLFWQATLVGEHNLTVSQIGSLTFNKAVGGERPVSQEIFHNDMFWYLDVVLHDISVKIIYIVNWWQKTLYNKL